MYEVVLFFPDLKKLIAFTDRLQCGPVEIATGNLTVKACLEADQILDAMLLYEATPCSADFWEKLEQWMVAFSKQPNGKSLNQSWRRMPGKQFLF